MSGCRVRMGGCVIDLSTIGRLGRSCRRNILRLCVTSDGGTSGCWGWIYPMAKTMTD